MRTGHGLIKRADLISWKALLQMEKYDFGAAPRDDASDTLTSKAFKKVQFLCRVGMGRQVWFPGTYRANTMWHLGPTCLVLDAMTSVFVVYPVLRIKVLVGEKTRFQEYQWQVMQRALDNSRRSTGVM